VGTAAPSSNAAPVDAVVNPAEREPVVDGTAGGDTAIECEAPAGAGGAQAWRAASPRASIPEITIGEATIGRDRIEMIKSDAPYRPVATSAPEFIRIDVESMSRESLLEVARREGQQAEGEARPSEPPDVPQRRTIEWGNPPAAEASAAMATE